MGRLASGVDHYVEAAAMTHGHHGLDGAVFAFRVKQGVEQRDESGDAFERKSLGAEIPSLQDLLEEIGANEAFENFGLVSGGRRDFQSLNDPAAALRVKQMHEIGADGAAVITASFLRGGACELPEVGRGDWLE